MKKTTETPPKPYFKTCSKCGEEKDIGEFNKNKKAPDGKKLAM